jgi:DHA1 family bicyclomycin/chloramphenicol resistance-like MFS transporter
MSMMAMDLYLPAVPSLQKALGLSVTLAQATIAVFLVGLAASQFLWAEIFNKVGPKRAVEIGTGLLLAASIVGALAPNIEILLLARLAQGIAAGAATVVAPSVVRATLSAQEAIRGIAAISTIEAIVPAAAPVLGVALLAYLDWRGILWVLSALTLAVLPFAVRATPRELPGMNRTVDASYLTILANRKYWRIALSHALCIGAMLTFVASAPQLMIHALGQGVEAFAKLQVLGVAAFMVMASQSGRISQWLGPQCAVQWGAWVQVVLCAALLLGSAIAEISFVDVEMFWCLFCGSLAVRGPPAFSDALSLPPAQMGRASAMFMLAILLASAAGTQLVAPFMDGNSVAPLIVAMLIPLLVSVMLVAPYPKAVVPAESTV